MMNFVVFWKIDFHLFLFWGICGLRDRDWRILRKISVPNAPFSWRLLPPASRKFGTQDFLLNVWRIPRCRFLFDEFCCFLKNWFSAFPFLGICGLRDRDERILRKISVPNAPFSWRLIHPHSATVVRKLFTQLFDEFQGAVFEICLRLRTFTNLQSS